LPGAIGGVWPAGGAPGGVSVVPGRFGQRPAGEAVAGLGDVPAGVADRRWSTRWG
jgi:hypothetical protein